MVFGDHQTSVIPVQRKVRGRFGFAPDLRFRILDFALARIHCQAYGALKSFLVWICVAVGWCG